VTREDKAKRISAILDNLYAEPPIPLAHVDAFSLLVAVLLSAQTTDVRVNMVTPALFSLARTPEAMAELPVSEILNAIRTCGLAPTKAKNIRRLSEVISQQHAGEVPASLTALEALPGVGHKTASVVMSQAFGVPAFPVDTHIHRLASRWGLSNGKNVERTEADLKRVFARSMWSKIHLQIIYFGREYCPARGHDLAACPICGWSASKRRIHHEAKARSTTGRKPQQR
jgi:endonuclease-3